MSGYTVHVSGLAPETDEIKINDFFSFCGKLISVTKTEKSAVLVFEKESASRTALMLNGGTLDGAHLEVTSASQTATGPSTILPSGPSGSTPIGAALESGDIEQHDKPATGIVAEYLAHGYVLSDHIVQRAIELDHKQGISSKFLSFITSIDKKVGDKVVGPEQTVSGKVTEQLHAALDKTKEVDQNRGISRKTGDYYSKAIQSPVGQKVYQFYTTTSKQVVDVHEEAKRIAAAKKAASGYISPATPVTSESTPLVPGTVLEQTTTTTTTTTTAGAPVARRESLINQGLSTLQTKGAELLGHVERMTGTGAAGSSGVPLTTQLGQVVNNAKGAVADVLNDKPAVTGVQAPAVGGGVTAPVVPPTL